jgi:hypothetical protein
VSDSRHSTSLHGNRLDIFHIQNINFADQKTYTAIEIDGINYYEYEAECVRRLVIRNPKFNEE